MIRREGAASHYAFAGEPPANPAILKIDGDTWFVSIDGRQLEDFPPDTAPAEPPPDVRTSRNQWRKLRIDPGEHTVTVGLARQWMPLLRGELVGVEKIAEHGALPVEAPAHNALRFATRRLSGELRRWRAGPMPASTSL